MIRTFFGGGGEEFRIILRSSRSLTVLLLRLLLNDGADAVHGMPSPQAENSI